MSTQDLRNLKVHLVALMTGLLLLTACSPDTSNRGASEAGRDKTSDVGAIRSSGGTFSVPELREILRQQDPGVMSESLNNVKKLGTSREGLQLLREVWDGNRSKFPELAWTTIEDPQVQLDLVDILVQAAMNGEASSEPSDAHDYVIGVLNSESPKLVSQALISLAVFERPDDVQTIERVALRQDRRTFRSAVIALSTMCATGAAEALDRIEQATSGQYNEFTKETRTRMSDYHRRTGACGLLEDQRREPDFAD